MDVRTPPWYMYDRPQALSVIVRPQAPIPPGGCHRAVVASSAVGSQRDPLFTRQLQSVPGCWCGLSLLPRGRCVYRTLPELRPKSSKP